MNAPNSCPAHLSRRSKRLWRSVASTWDVDDPAAQELLRMLCEAVDRRDQARERLLKEGLTVTDRYDQIKPHPAVAIEASSRMAAARLMRDLGLTESEV